jgi:hypothetical protein
MSITIEKRDSRGDLNFTAQLARLLAGNPTALVEWSRYTDDALIHRQSEQMGWHDQKCGPTLVTHMVRIVDIKETDSRS